MKKVLIIAGVVLVLAVVGLVGWRFFGSPEDTWLCTKTGWVKHGNPTAARPGDACIAGKIKKAEMVAVKVFFGNSKLNPNAADCSLVYPVERIINKDSDRLPETLMHLMSGPTEEEQAQGYESFFTRATLDLFTRVQVEGDKAFVDFKDFRRIITNANSSCGGAQFLSELDTTIKTAAPEVKTTVYSINGEPTTFYEWMQLGCGESNNWCNSPFSKVSVTPKAEK